jgi:hypothetical protein
VGVEVLGAALVEVLHHDAGRDQADATGADGVCDAVDGHLGAIAVEVQLPQVGQLEDVAAADRSVHADPQADHRGRMAQAGRERLGSHGENLPVMVIVTHA